MASPVVASVGALGAAAAASITPGYPASIAAGDLLILLTSTRDNVEVDTPSGWSQDVTDGARNQSTGLRGEWFYKWADGTESGTLTVTKVSGTTTFMGLIIRITGGLGSGTPYDLTAQTGLGNNATWTPSDLDPADAKDRLMLVLAAGNNDLLTAGNYTGGTATVTENGNVETSLGLDGTLHVASAAHTADTLFDFGAQTTANSHAHVLFSIAILPSAGGSPQTVNPTGLASAAAFGSPTAVPGGVSLSMTGLTSAGAFGIPSVIAGDVSVSVLALASAAAFGTPTLVPGGTVIAVTGLGSAAQFGSLTTLGGDLILVTSDGRRRRMRRARPY